MTLCPDSTVSLVAPSLSNCPFSQSTPLKLGVMASGSGSNFEAVAEAIAKEQLNAQIQVLIYNNPSAKAPIRAANRGVEAVLLNHRDYGNREAFDGAIVKTLQQYDVDWVIMAGWMRLVTPVLIDAFIDKIINIHPSLLPSFKGINAVEQALASGVKITGCTVHLVCLEVDSGPILIQAAVPILPEDTAETLHARIQIQEHRILPQAIAIAAAREISQNNS
ncbi:phosphoribosylglycinamide formyltransferase [Nodularia harveyana UHCC-0300]|uniref:Phosphoribosylglycinamide formyltransferase n=1 Tax=Nodularia harveyana UHCC-0300 TaxID=2974287 RepID=A0ABU5U9W0_9CYAN|nr:phosphoribosylglycinamide formyltransferase [Nodularia harveyana]MEA5580316.1 phosphoribosylglycinamide formyltransferase [Nodularia harveyana UHCC-0300]